MSSKVGFFALLRMTGGRAGFLWYNLGVIERRTVGKSDIFRRVVIIAARVLLGLALGLVLSMIALGVSWGLFIFSGASAKSTLLIMSMGGAGIGAGVGAYLAWLKVDRPPWGAIAFAVLLAVAGGVLGGLVGYQYGANREIECCAEPRTAPFTYTAFGAALAANAVMYLAEAGGVAVRMIRASRRRAISG